MQCRPAVLRAPGCGFAFGHRRIQNACAAGSTAPKSDMRWSIRSCVIAASGICTSRAKPEVTVERAVSNPLPRHSSLVWLWLTAGVVMLDQLSKTLVERYLQLSESSALLPVLS